jgi:MerR family transcriptional regulator, light-induced transcriptional regulator
MIPSRDHGGADFASRLRELRLRQGLRQKDLAITLGLAQTTIANYEKKLRFPDESTLLRIADYFNTSLDFLLGRVGSHAEGGNGVRSSAGTAAVPEADGALSGLGREYFAALRTEGREAAFTLVRRSLARGMTVREIYLNVFEPALKEVGRLWAAGEMHVGDEHFFTEATQTLIAQLYPALRAEAQPRKGRRLFSFGVCGEYHVIGPRMVADFFEMDGWDAVFLGGNLCVQHAMRAMRDQPPDLLALSVTIPLNIGSARELIMAVRETAELGALKIMVGGQAFAGAPGLWQDIGAHALARDPQEAVDLGNRLVGEKQEKAV